MNTAKHPEPPTGKDRYASPIDADHVDKRIRSSIRAQVIEAIKKNPELALAIIRAWKDAES